MCAKSPWPQARSTTRPPRYFLLTRLATSQASKSSLPGSVPTRQTDRAIFSNRVLPGNQASCLTVSRLLVDRFTRAPLSYPPLLPHVPYPIPQFASTKFQINSKFQYPNLKQDTNQRLIVILIDPILMIGMSFVQDHKVWNFEFGYCDLFVIWFLAIVFYLRFVFCFLT